MVDVGHQTHATLCFDFTWFLVALFWFVEEFSRMRSFREDIETQPLFDQDALCQLAVIPALDLELPSGRLGSWSRGNPDSVFLAFEPHAFVSGTVFNVKVRPETFLIAHHPIALVVIALRPGVDAVSVPMVVLVTSCVFTAVYEVLGSLSTGHPVLPFP